MITQDIAQITRTVIDYIGKNTHFNLQNIMPQTKLFKEGIFDSMAFVLLIDFIELTYEIKPSDEDLIEENFESIESIANYIHRKMAVTVI
jgi:acyl carrier protein